MAMVPFAFLNYDQNKKYPICTFATSFAPTYATYSVTENNVVVISTAIVYGLTASVLLYRYKTARFSTSTQKNEWRRQIDLDVFVAMSTVGTLYVITYGSRSVLSAILASKLSIQITQKLTPCY